MKKCRIALVSFASEFGEPEKNLARIVEWIRTATKKRVDLVCFPELALQGYHDDAETMREQAEPVDGPACRVLARVAAECDTVVSLGMAALVDGRVYNAQALFDGRGLFGFATKVHLGSSEQHLFESGESWPVFDLGFAKMGAAICFDAEFPEAARCLALDGAEIVLMSFATGRCDSCGRSQEPSEWARQVQAWAPSRAYDNRIFVLGVNHAGNVRDQKGLVSESWAEPGQTHRWPGYSFAYGPDGSLIAESTQESNAERMLVVDLDPQLLEQWREGSGNFLSQRRPETYSRIVQTKQGSSEESVGRN